MASSQNKVVFVDVYLCIYWTRLVLVRAAASLYSASQLKHHATGRQ